MKKAILTFGLFSLVVLTSFTTTETQKQNITMEIETGDTGNTGGQGQDLRGSNKKLDGFTETGGQGQDLRGSNKKLDAFAEKGGQDLRGSNKKLD